VDYKALNKKEFYKLRHEWKELNKEHGEIQEIFNKISIKFIEYVCSFTKEHDIANPFEKNIEDSEKDNRGSKADITSSSQVKSLFRDVVIQTHPDKATKNSKDLYIEATRAKKENNLHKLLDVGKKLKLNLKEISRDQLRMLQKNIEDLREDTRQIKLSHPWVWFHGSQGIKHEVVYDFLHKMECIKN